MTSFFYCGRLSSAQLHVDRWQAPKQRPIIDQRPVEQTAFQREIKDLVTMDINPSLQILGWYVKAQILDKGIRQKYTKRVNSFIACSAFYPGRPNRDPRDSEKRWRVYTSIAMMARHAWRVYKSSGKKHTNRNACTCIDAHRSAVPTKNCEFIRHPMQTG